MKLAKALKLKNQLAGQIANLKETLKTQNCRPAKQPFDYDNQDLWRQLRTTVDELVRVKTIIAVANISIYDRVFRLAELKGLIASLGTLETKQGTFNENEGYRGAANPVEYRSQLSRQDLDRLIVELQAEVRDIQDTLDEFNATQGVTL
jgi:hypothetical protein